MTNAENNGQGALTEAVYYILLSLYQPMHGYGIMQKIKELSNDRVIIGAGTMYGAIQSLLKKEWIEPLTSDEGARKKEYQITKLGKEIVRQEILRLEELVKNGRNIIGGESK